MREIIGVHRYRRYFEVPKRSVCNGASIRLCRSLRASRECFVAALSPHKGTRCPRDESTALRCLLILSNRFFVQEKSLILGGSRNELPLPIVSPTQRPITQNRRPQRRHHGITNLSHEALHRINHTRSPRIRRSGFSSDRLRKRHQMRQTRPAHQPSNRNLLQQTERPKTHQRPCGPIKVRRPRRGHHKLRRSQDPRSDKGQLRPPHVGPLELVQRTIPRPVRKLGAWVQLEGSRQEWLPEVHDRDADGRRGADEEFEGAVQYGRGV